MHKFYGCGTHIYVGLVNSLIRFDNGGIEDGPANLHYGIGQSAVALGLLFSGDEGVVERNASQGYADANEQILWLLQIGQQYECHAAYHEGDGQRKMDFNGSGQVGPERNTHYTLGSEQVSDITHLLCRSHNIPAMLATTESQSTELK